MFIFFFSSCGKKAENTSLPVEVERPTITELENYLEKQDVNCESNQACPSYIVKIIAVNGGVYNVCTGFLTEDNLISTSTSCLPALLRQRDQDCSQDVFFFFPKTWNRAAERAGCRKVIQASELDGDDPVLWRDDVAFLSLDKEIKFRKPAVISRDGLMNRRLHTMWMVDQQDEYSAVVKKVVCETNHGSFINPLVFNESSPNQLLSDCLMTKGATGAPVLDNRGKVRAIASRNMDSKLREYLFSTGLLNQGLKEMFHATNFACAATPFDTNTLDERECRKDLTYAELDRARSEMLATNILFGDLRKKYEESLKDLSRYVHFGVKLIPKGDSQETQIYPKCFKPFKDWLGSMNPSRNVFVQQLNLPQKSFRRMMDPLAKVYGATSEGPNLEYYLQISLKTIRSDQRSTILMWPKGGNVIQFPQSFTECESSLP